MIVVMTIMEVATMTKEVATITKEVATITKEVATITKLFQNFKIFDQISKFRPYFKISTKFQNFQGKR